MYEMIFLLWTRMFVSFYLYYIHLYYILTSFTGKNIIIKKNGESQILICEAYVLFDSLNISPSQFESPLNPSAFQSGTHREEIYSCFLAALALFSAVRCSPSSAGGSHSAQDQQSPDTALPPLLG